MRDSQDFLHAIKYSLSLARLFHTSACTRTRAHTHTNAQSERFDDSIHLHLEPTPRSYSNSPQSPFISQNRLFSLWTGQKCIAWLRFLYSVLWDKTTAKTPPKHLVLECSDTAGRPLWLAGSVVTRCLQKDTPRSAWRWSTTQREEWGLHSKSSVIGEHQSVCRSTESTAVPTMFHSPLTRSEDFIHICATMGQRSTLP